MITSESLNDVDFRMNIDVEGLLDIALDGLAEGNNLKAGGASAIDKNEGLLVVNACPSHRAALPTTTVYHPACRNFLVQGINRIVRHVRITGCQRLVLLTGYDRIHEETACIALNFGVRQLGITDINNRLTHIGDGQVFLFAQHRLDIAVFQLQLR